MRYVRGLVLDKFDPQFGEEFRWYEIWENYTLNRKNLPLHAWIEYYVPTLGWLVCDPTWSDSGKDYFNNLDTIHFRYAAGSWFSLPNFQFEYSYMSLEPSVPFYSCDYNFMVQISVLSDNDSNFFLQYGIFFVSLALVSVLMFMELLKLARRK